MLSTVPLRTSNFEVRSASAEAVKMEFELDHVFICTEAEANEAERLADFGLIEGAPNVHTGQGTANRRFFFANAYLELLWVHNPAKAQAGAVNRTRLWPRWKDR